MPDTLDIPVPKNARPGDPFFAENSLASMPNKFFFEPPAELVTLPSHGYLYKNISSDPDVVEKGAIKIRPMTVAEEKILATPRLVKSGQAIDMVFEACVKSQIDPKEMLSSDRVFLMLWLRSISYGNVYKFQLTSPEPGNPVRFEYEVDLSNHPITEFTDPEISEPFTFVFPKCKYVVQFRLPRGKDEIEIMKMGNAPKKLDDRDETIVTRLTSIILKLSDPDGKDVPPAYYQSFVNQLMAGDASSWRNKLQDLDCGVEDIKNIQVPGTDFVFDTPIPITESFFRVTG
jgi:hypothetical protein